MILLLHESRQRLLTSRLILLLLVTIQQAIDLFFMGFEDVADYSVVYDSGALSGGMHAPHQENNFYGKIKGDPI
jgi:hypothetical protein